MTIRIDIVLLAVASLSMAGCGAPAKKEVSAEEAAERAGLRREQFSTQGQGTQKIEGGDGTTTELLKVDDLGQYGLELYPGATAKDGDAYRRTDPKTVTVFYSLVTSDPAKNVVKFYEGKLGKEGHKSGQTGTIIVGSLGNGKSSVVTVVDEGANGSRAEVQILGDAEK